MSPQKTLLRAVPEAPKLDLVTKAFKTVDAARITRHGRDIFSEYFPSTEKHTPGHLGWPARITGLSAKGDMGLELVRDSRELLIHIDQAFLYASLERTIHRLRPVMAYHFALTAVANALTATRFENRVFEADPHTTRIDTWKYASYVALEKMRMPEADKAKLLVGYRKEAREREQAYAEDMMFFTHIAAQHEVKPPVLQRVVPWVGVAFPKPLEDLMPPVILK